MDLLRLSVLVVGLLSVGVTRAAPVRLAAEDWPPYVTSALPGNGLTGAMISAVLERLGDTLDVDYFPWKRTVEYGLHNPLYAGYMAVWRTPERDKLCYFSSPVGRTQSVIAYLKEAPVRASTLTDLRELRVGVVGGYANGDEFDALVHSGVLHVEEGVNDSANLRKLLSHRFSVMVIEKHVLRYLLASPEFREARDRIAISTELFHERTV